MNKGAIWLVEFPETNGREQKGTRPVIILADTKTNIAVIIPSTSNIQALRFPYTFQIKSSKKNGLIADSIALIFQIRAIDKKRLKKHIGNLERPTIKKIDKMIKKLLLLA